MEMASSTQLETVPEHARWLFWFAQVETQRFVHDYDFQVESAVRSTHSRQAAYSDGLNYSAKCRTKLLKN